MNKSSSQKPETPIQPPDTKTSNHPASKVAPMGPAGSDINHTDNIVRFSEELMAGPPDDAL
jgi:hypothetical protein